MIACLAGFAAIALAQENYHRAAQLMAAVETQFNAISIRLLYMDKLEYERSLGQLNARLNEKDIHKSWDKGKIMSLDQVIAFAIGET
jgi:hypothetical protein